MPHRTSDGRFARFTAWKVAMGILTILLVLYLYLLADGLLKNAVKPLTYQAEERQVDLSIPDTREKVITKIAELKKEVIAKIKQSESHGYQIANGELFYVNDPKQSDRAKCAVVGGKRSVNCDSFGANQFKLTTIQHYYQTFYGQDITQLDALLVALDSEKADALTTKIIFDEKGGIFNWQNTYNSNKDFFETAITQVRTLESVL